MIVTLNFTIILFISAVAVVSYFIGVISVWSRKSDRELNKQAEEHYRTTIKDFEKMKDKLDKLYVELNLEYWEGIEVREIIKN